MNWRLIVRPEAEAELADAYDWYDGCVSGLGDEFLLCVDAVMNAVSRAPQQFPCVYKNVRQALTRRFPYEVLFVAEHGYIVILAVFHVRRNPSVWRERI